MEKAIILHNDSDYISVSPLRTDSVEANNSSSSEDAEIDDMIIDILVNKLVKSCPKTDSGGSASLPEYTNDETLADYITGCNKSHETGARSLRKRKLYDIVKPKSWKKKIFRGRKNFRKDVYKEKPDVVCVENVNEKKKKKKKKVLVGESLRLRSTPTPLFDVMSRLKESQKNCLKDIGFEKLEGFTIDSIPGKLAHFVVSSFDKENMVIRTRVGDIEVNADAVHEVFGIPLGGTCIMSLPDHEDAEFVNQWKGQYDSSSCIRPRDIVSKIVHSDDCGLLFQMNFLMLFANTMGLCEQNGVCMFMVLEKLSRDTPIRSLDWCGFIIDCLRKTKKPSSKAFWIGPVTFLTLLYVDQTKFEKMSVVRSRPVFRSWTSYLLKDREDGEIEAGGFGLSQMQDSLFLNEEERTENDADNPVLKIENNIISDTPLDNNGYYNKIEHLFKVFGDVKLILEKTLKESVDKFPVDEKFVEYGDFYMNLLKSNFRKAGEKENEKEDVEFTFPNSNYQDDPADDDGEFVNDSYEDEEDILVHDKFGDLSESQFVEGTCRLDSSPPPLPLAPHRPSMIEGTCVEDSGERENINPFPDCGLDDLKNYNDSIVTAAAAISELQGNKDLENDVRDHGKVDEVNGTQWLEQKAVQYSLERKIQGLFPEFVLEHAKNSSWPF